MGKAEGRVIQTATICRIDKKAVTKKTDKNVKMDGYLIWIGNIIDGAY